MSAPDLQIACLCGGVGQAVKTRIGENAHQLGLSLCHCDACRHASGLLCASYYPIHEPAITSSLRRYKSSDGSTRYFCSTCGCHVFRVSETAWEVATGVVKGPGDDHDGQGPLAKYERHVGVGDTKDGGIAVWLPAIGGHALETDATSASAMDVEGPGADTLPASCDCRRIKFELTRPNEASTQPHSPFPDLLRAHGSSDAASIKNAADSKWWLRGDGTKYLAGLCACRSCRLASGFEVQAWAFVPRRNITFDITPPSSSVPLDFPAGILATYTSSPGVARDFCGRCGATVFWHDEERPGVVDVSVGVLRAAEGARAERWLDWWTGRVSFAEHAAQDRWGGEAERARLLVQALEEGMKGAQ